MHRDEHFVWSARRHTEGQEAVEVVEAQESIGS
jgi:hypothetical protein